MSDDVVSEMMTGERGSVRCIGKFYISPRRQHVSGMPLVMMGGAVVSPAGGKLVLPENEDYAEMWECEIIIIPKRKYSSFGKEGNLGGQHSHGRKIPFNGWRIDQVLTSDYGDPEAWGREYFKEQKK